LTPEDDQALPFEEARSIEELATQYIKEIKTVQPIGPYTLGGACFGGVVAFEMAQQLRATGESMASPLLLFDAFVEDPDGPARSRLHRAQDYLTSRFASHLDPELDQKATIGTRQVLSMAARHPAAVLRLPFAAARAIRWRIVKRWFWTEPISPPESNPVERTQDGIMERFLERSFQLLRRYHPLPYDGSAALFIAEDGVNSEAGWSHVIRGPLDCHVLPGEHLEMLEEPSVVTTTELVSRYIGTESANGSTRVSRARTLWKLRYVRATTAFIRR
jgi:thioesterase domain-containing protein